MVISGINSLYTARSSGVSTTELRWETTLQMRPTRSVMSVSFFDRVGPVGVLLRFDDGDLFACFGNGGLQGRFDVFGFDLVETGFFAQVEQDIVAHMVSPG